MTQVMRIQDKALKIDLPDGYYTVTVEKIRKPRTTGPRSQNSAIHGYCHSIAIQLDQKADRVYQAMKRRAVAEYGYPCDWNAGLCEWEPRSQSKASKEEASLLVQCVKDFADLHDLWLIEYIDGQPVKTLRGERYEHI